MATRLTALSYALFPAILGLSVAVGLGPESQPAAWAYQSGQATCTATWTEMGADVTAGTWWSLASGAPHGDAFSLEEDCTYDSGEPSNTPLIWPPPPLPHVEVNGVETPVTNLRPESGEFTLLTDVDAGSTVEVDFHFEVPLPPTATPTPEPIPSVSQVAMLSLAVVLGLAMVVRLKRKSWRASGRRS